MKNKEFNNNNIKKMISNENKSIQKYTIAYDKIGTNTPLTVSSSFLFNLLSTDIE